jgi:hypothetical protein
VAVYFFFQLSRCVVVLSENSANLLPEAACRPANGGFASTTQNSGLCISMESAKTMTDCAAIVDSSRQFRSVIDDEPHNLLTDHIDIGSIQYEPCIYTS